MNFEYKLGQEIYDYINECKAKEHPESYLIAVLHKIQETHGFLSRNAMDEVGHILGIPTAEVFGVATFYHYFKLIPQGKFQISCCLGTACFVKGGETILDSFKKELGIEVGETTTDGNFSLVETRCLGVCALAPVVMINGKVHSNVTPKEVPQIIQNLLKEA